MEGTAVTEALRFFWREAHLRTANWILQDGSSSNANCRKTWGYHRYHRNIPSCFHTKKGAEMSRNEQIMLMQDCRGLELVSTQKLRRRLSIKPMLYTHIYIYRDTYIHIRYIIIYK